MSVAAEEEYTRCLTPEFFYQETFEKASLSSSSSGAASLKSELSESAELPGEGCHIPCGKEEDRVCEEVLSEDNFQLESVEKGGCTLSKGRAGRYQGPSAARHTHPLLLFHMQTCILS